MILPLPDRKEFETELRDEILERTDQKDMAGYLRISPSRISRQLDPYNANCPSPNYQLLEWLWAADAKNPAKGGRMLEQIIRERQKWLINVPPTPNESANLTTNIFESATEFLKTESSDADPETLLNKIENLRMAVEKKADDLKIKKAAKSGLLK